MLLKDNKNNTVEISAKQWPLAIDLFVKWGHPVSISTEVINVVDVNDITPELSSWGILWKRKY